MTVQRPRAKKPNAVDEAARVLRLFDIIAGEMNSRLWAEAWRKRPLDLLIVAERIAARTEDELGR